MPMAAAQRAVFQGCKVGPCRPVRSQGHCTALGAVPAAAHRGLGALCLKSCNACGSQLPYAVHIQRFPRSPAVDPSIRKQRRSPGKHIPHIGHIAVTLGQLHQSGVCCIKHMPAQHPHGTHQPPGFRASPLPRTSLSLRRRCTGIQGKMCLLTEGQPRFLGRIQLSQQPDTGIQHFHMVHRRLLPMGAVLQDLEPQLGLQLLPGPCFQTRGQQLPHPGISCTECCGLQHTPVAEGVFKDISLPKVRKLGGQTVDHRPGFLVGQRIFCQQKRQQLDPVHAADTGINGAGGRGPLPGQRVGGDPIHYRIDQFAPIPHLSGQYSRLPELGQVVVPVEHEHPFRVSIGAMGPLPCGHSIGDGAGFHIPPVGKDKGILHQIFRLVQQVLRLGSAVRTDIGGRGCGVILSIKTAGRLAYSPDHMVHHNAPPFIFASQGHKKGRDAQNIPA